MKTEPITVYNTPNVKRSGLEIEVNTNRTQPLTCSSKKKTKAIKQMNCQKCRSTGCKRIDAVKSPVRRDREGAVTITVFITHVSHTSPALTAGDNVTDCITVNFFLLIFEEEKSYHRACACERVRWVRTPSNNGVAFGWCSCFGITVFFFFFFLFTFCLFGFSASFFFCCSFRVFRLGWSFV